jgi:hypothetical protein
MSLWAMTALIARGQDAFELPPIEYTRSTPDNRVSTLEARIDRREASLRHERGFGYLRDLLKQLDIRDDTQMLVFSKTSLQRDRISPRTPRAIYFNDDSYVGYCHAGNTIEIAVADPQLGAVFYTLDQTNADAPQIARQTHDCLQCHSAAQTEGIPGFLVRSVFTGRSGLPILSEGSHRVDHTTPIADRWGGWYVSGTHGAQKHQGNFVVLDPDAQRPWMNEQGQNVIDLSDRFLTRNYLTSHSDIVALMVFEHQTYVHNLITQANFAARQALHYERGINEALGDPTDKRLESTTRRIESAGEKLLEGLLMVDEAPLQGPIAGTSPFAKEFSRLGPRDEQGHSLRDLDLTRRLFTFPCSYLVYSRSFDELPPVLKNYIKKRLSAILAGQGGDKFAHLSQSDRDSIVAILKATKPDLLSSPL